MKIDEALGKVTEIPYVTIFEDNTLEDAGELITRAPHIRGIYVVDTEGRLTGYLSLGVLIRNIMAVQHKPLFHVRSLLSRITAERVSDIMDKPIIHARRNDDIAIILDQMVNQNIKQIAVVDENRKIIANIGIIDLWKVLKNNTSRACIRGQAH